MRGMGIDPATWDTAQGTDFNWETIKRVYDFYGQAYLADAASLCAIIPAGKP